MARFLFWATALGCVGLWMAAPFAGALLPLFRVEMGWLDDAYRIDRLYIGHDGSDRVVRVEVGLAHSLTVNGQTFSPDPRGEAIAETLVGNVSLPCVLLAAAAFAWPSKSPSSTVARVLAVPPAVLLLCMAGVPFILLASIWGLILQTADPSRFSPLLTWSGFLLNGGSLALAITCGAALGHLSNRR